MKSLVILLFVSIAMIAQNDDKKSKDFDWDEESFVYYRLVEVPAIIKGCEDVEDKKSCFRTKIDEIISEYNFKCSDCKGVVKLYLNIHINRYGATNIFYIGTIKGVKSNDKIFTSHYSKNSKKRKKFEKYLNKKIKIIEPAKVHEYRKEYVNISLSTGRLTLNF